MGCLYTRMPDSSSALDGPRKRSGEIGPGGEFSSAHGASADDVCDVRKLVYSVFRVSHGLVTCGDSDKDHYDSECW